MSTLENVKKWFIDRDLEKGFASKEMCRHNLVRCTGTCLW